MSESEDPLYLFALEYEYLCETFDRTLDGRIDGRGYYIPFDMKRSSGHAFWLGFRLIQKYMIEYDPFKNNHHLRRFQTMSYEELKRTYDHFFRKQGLTVSQSRSISI